MFGRHFSNLETLDAKIVTAVKKMFLDSNIGKKFFSEEEEAQKEDRILPWQADRVYDLHIFSG